jgi:undecaprenyl-diphosphatase
MVVGGIILLFVDNIFNVHTIQQEENISYGRALVIGFWQCVAMIPGVSRSAASIVGGMQQKLTRKLAAEFSFYLAVPTMIAATGYKLLKEYKNIHTHEIKLLALGNVVAFIVAMLAIKFFIGFLQKHGFKIFGMYRIIAGIVLLLLIWKGYIQ